jgi:LmbE family N-acetylglucosaminyl deacetylase
MTSLSPISPFRSIPTIPTPSQLGFEAGPAVSSEILVPLSGQSTPSRPAVQKPYFTFQDISKVKPADVLVVLAHPDDELLMSGTIEQLAQSGKSVQLLYATNGSEGRDVSGRNLSDDLLGETRSEEAIQASKPLNVHRPPMILDFMDGKTGDFPEALKEQLRAVLVQAQPEMVLMYNAKDGLTGHQDHKNVATYLQQEFDAIANGQTPRDQQDRSKLSKLLQGNGIYEAILPQSASPIFRQFFPLWDPSWKDVRFQPDAKTNMRVFLPQDVLNRKQASMQQHTSQYRNEDIQKMNQFFTAYPYESFTRYQIQNNQPIAPFVPNMSALKNQG